MMMRRTKRALASHLSLPQAVAPMSPLRLPTAATTPPVLSETFVADGTKVMLCFTSLNAGVAGITVDGITIWLMSAPQ